MNPARLSPDCSAAKTAAPPSLRDGAEATERMLFDFSDPARSGDWEVVNDDVMGGVSSSRFAVEGGVAVFSGEVSLAHGGGFASARSWPAPLGLAGCAALVVRVRGDGHHYKCTARVAAAPNGAHYQCRFATVAGEWEELTLPFASFTASFRGWTPPDAPPLNPAWVVSVGFLIAEKQAGPFRLEVAWMRGREAAPQ